MALAIADFAGIRDTRPDTTEAMHLQIEAMKLALADVYAYAADLASMLDVTVAHLLNPGYLRSRAAMIDRMQAQDFGAGAPREGGTVCLATGDADGMMVSYIQSNYSGFGSGVVIPGTGISLQNCGAGFNLTTGHPNWCRASETAVPYDHSRLRDARARAADGVRVDGRPDPGPGSLANDAAHPALATGPANRSGRAAMALLRRVSRGGRSPRARARPSRTFRTRPRPHTRAAGRRLWIWRSADRATERRKVMSAGPTRGKTVRRRVFEGRQSMQSFASDRRLGWSTEGAAATIPPPLWGRAGEGAYCVIDGRDSPARREAPPSFTLPHKRRRGSAGGRSHFRMLTPQTEAPARRARRDRILQTNCPAAGRRLESAAAAVSPSRSQTKCPDWGRQTSRSWFS